MVENSKYVLIDSWLCTLLITSAKSLALLSTFTLGILFSAEWYQKPALHQITVLNSVIRFSLNTGCVHTALTLFAPLSRIIWAAFGD
jgi:hypothetical protein